MDLLVSKTHELNPATQFTFQQCLKGIESVAKRAVNGSPDFDKFDDVMSLLDSLPLATDEYGISRNRMFNARRYLAAGERAAAAYELRLVRHTLSRHVA